MEEPTGTGLRYVAAPRDTLARKGWAVRDTWTKQDVTILSRTPNPVLPERSAKRLAGEMNAKLIGRHDEFVALTLIEDLEEFAEFVHVDIDTPTVEHDGDKVTGIRLTGATFTTLNNLLQRKPLTDRPLIEVAHVIMTADAFDTLSNQVMRRLADRD